jgi:hypothetical protein
VRGANMGRDVWMERVVMGYVWCDVLGTWSWREKDSGANMGKNMWMERMVMGYVLVWGLGALVVVGERV